MCEKQWAFVFLHFKNALNCTTFLFLSEVRPKLIKFGLCWLHKVGMSFDQLTGFSMFFAITWVLIF